MIWIVASMKWIMLVSGTLTCTMLYAAIAPEAALQSTFGETLQGPVAEIGRPFIAYQAGVAVVSDLIQVSLFLMYLLAIRSSARSTA